MKLNQHLKDWKQIVSQRFPHLSLPLDLLPQDTQELPIAVDATSKGQNFTVVSINLLLQKKFKTAAEASDRLPQLNTAHQNIPQSYS